MDRALSCQNAEQNYCVTREGRREEAGVGEVLLCASVKINMTGSSRMHALKVQQV